MIYPVQPEEFPDYLPMVEEFLDSFEDRSGGDITAAEIAADVIDMRRQCYVAVIDGEIRACAVTRVTQTGRISVDFCAGRGREEWGDAMLEYFMAWAEAEGRELVVNCRTGWTRALRMRERGFRETHRVMEWRP